MAVKRIDQFDGGSVIVEPTRPNYQARRGKTFAGAVGIAGAFGNSKQTAIKATGVPTSTEDLQAEAARVLGEALGD
jgi:hypothetical protein